VVLVSLRDQSVAAIFMAITTTIPSRWKCVGFALSTTLRIITHENMMPERFWTCKRQRNGQRCGAVNAARKRNCEACGLPRQRRQTSKDKHEAALRDLTYEDYIEINGGEFCGICGCGPGTRRLHRDHEHKGDGTARGLLCFRHNLVIPDYMTLELARAVVAYLERFEQRRGRSTDGNGGQTEKAQAGAGPATQP
jgi:Recombination endonuclease VII